MTMPMHEYKAKEFSTSVGLEPTRDKPNRFLVDRLNRSATMSVTRIALTIYITNKLVGQYLQVDLWPTADGPRISYLSRDSRDQHTFDTPCWRLEMIQ